MAARDYSDLATMVNLGRLRLVKDTIRWLTLIT